MMHQNVSPSNTDQFPKEMSTLTRKGATMQGSMYQGFMETFTYIVGTSIFPKQFVFFHS